ncbi:MAG: patatin-like phospholipase family protein [Bacteroidota bacterium]
MKRALVLAGGGSRGAFEAGAVDFLVRQSGLDFDLYLGTSVGALNAGILAQSRNYRELSEQTGILKKLWTGIKGSHSVYRKNLLGVFGLLFKDSLYNPTGLKNMIQQWVDPERLFSNHARVLKIATVAEETGELLYVDNRSPQLKADFLSYILASASIPLFFPAVKINGLHWYDGGLRDVTPLGAVFRERPDEIVVILTFPINQALNPILAPTKHQGALRAILRTLDIMSNEISANDLQLANAINQSHNCRPGQRRVPIRIIAPETPLTGSNVLEFKPDNIRENLKRGFQAARTPITLYEKPFTKACNR